MNFDKPLTVSGLDVAFGPKDINTLMPAYASIPEEFKRMSGYWPKWQAEWFFEGLKAMPTPKAGIDLNTAMGHLAAIQRSFEPKHEHKAAAVAYLASIWFKTP